MYLLWGSIELRVSLQPWNLHFVALLVYGFYLGLSETGNVPSSGPCYPFLGRHSEIL